MERTTIQVGTYGVNCSILAEDGQAWVVDPGSEAERILALLIEKRLKPVGILLTHAHFDHIGGIPGLQAAFPDLPVFVHPADVPAFTHPMNQCPPDYPPIAMPKNIRSVDATSSSHTNKERETPFIGHDETVASTHRSLFTFHFSRFTVIPTPGHTPGGICFFLPATGNRQPTTDNPPILFSGDTLFAGSVGRTDFPGGDMATLMRSLEKLKALPPETVVIPGHGPFTTIADELAGNPFLQ